MIAVPSPAALLSMLDRAAGGGRGVMRAGSAIPFGSHRQTLDVWRPVGPSACQYPVLIFWYGGGWVSGSRRDYSFAARAFARAGFVVVMPDYRKVPAVRFPAFVRDGAQAVRWVRDHIEDYGGDAGRIALAGHSAGAYTAVMLALDQQWLRAEGVDPALVKASIGLSGPYDFHPFTSQRAIDAMHGVADPGVTQPINFVRGDAPPMLLITSDGDSVVRPRNAISLAAQLRAAGAKVELRQYPKLRHEEIAMALSRPFRGLGPALADAIAFLKTVLKSAR